MGASFRGDVERVVREVAPARGVRLAVLFGSAVRDPDRARDVDIAVEGDVGPDDRLALSSEIEVRLGRPVDLVVLRPQTSELLRFEVFRAGVPVYERTAGLFREARRVAVLVHWDEGPCSRRQRLARIDAASGARGGGRGA
jgi:predicted nucleotidyltransferase